MILTEKTEELVETPVPVPLNADLGANPDLRRECPVTNRLSYGMAKGRFGNEDTNFIVKQLLI
jgi:hypothetical protein